MPSLRESVRHLRWWLDYTRVRIALLCYRAVLSALSDAGDIAAMGRQKYGAKPVLIDGHRFASKIEGRRYGELKMLQMAGLIADLQIHQQFPLSVNGLHICTYIADFSYYDKATGKSVVEDVKGYRDGIAYNLFRIKAKLLKALHGITVTEYPSRD